jgi:hypothetical protein
MLGVVGTAGGRRGTASQGILIGDVLFRKYLVQFDLTDKQVCVRARVRAWA